MSRSLTDLAAAEERREAVRDAARAYLRREWSLEKLRGVVATSGVAEAPSLWEGMRSLAWDQVERFGGVSDSRIGVGELCAIAEETGAALAPTPLIPAVVGQALLRDTGAEVVCELPVAAHRGGRSTDPLCSTVEAVEHAGGFRLTGVKEFVPYGEQADLLIVNATCGDGRMGLFVFAPDAPGVESTSHKLLDFSPCAELRFTAVQVPNEALLAVGEEAEEMLRESLALETLARCAELVGVAARALDLAVDYAKQRVAFGRPIGSFQAVQHKLVDLRGDVEVVRALYQGAAAQGEASDRDVAVAMTAFAAQEGLRKAPEGALQVFGGIGTTWEHDIHFFVRRAATLCALLGEKSGYRETVAASLAGETSSR